MKTIYLSCDPNCWTKDKIDQHMLGGTENFFLLLRKWLLEEGYEVFDPIISTSMRNDYDLAIHSNSFDRLINAKKHILWAGSWHAQGYEHVDKVIAVSEFFKNKMGWGDKAVVIYAPFGNDVLKYERYPIKGRIVSTSNPNRYLPYAVEVCKILDVAGIDYEWIISGGNRLYGPGFGESVSFDQYSHPRLHYRGILSRQELVALLGTAHMWVYPNFRDNSETLCVAISEAMALEIPCIAPNREPFKSVYSMTRLANNVLDVANEIVAHMNITHVVYPEIKEFSEDVAKGKVLEVVRSLL